MSITKRKRKPNTANLSALYAIDNKFAYKGDKLKVGVYGVVSKDTPFVYKIVKNKSGVARREFINNSTSLPNVCKNRLMAFFDDKDNKNKLKAYLVDKSLYDEYKGEKDK